MEQSVVNLLSISATVLTIVIGLLKIGTLIRALEKEHLVALQSLRDEAAAARSKIYDRLEAMRSEMAETYVRQDVQSETINRLLHAMDENIQVISNINTENEVARQAASQRRRRAEMK